MAVPTTSIPYGMRDIKLRAFTDSTNVTPAASSQDLPFARTLSFTESEDYEELRGDDQVVTTRGKGASVSWELESAGLSFEALKVVNGGSITLSGSSPNAVKTYRKLVTDARPFFKAEGQAISDSGGDVHAILYRCRSTGDVTGGFGDGAFWIQGYKGTGLPSLEVAALNALYDFIQNETAISPA